MTETFKPHQGTISCGHEKSGHASFLRIHHINLLALILLHGSSRIICAILDLHLHLSESTGLTEARHLPISRRLVTADSIAPVDRATDQAIRTSISADTVLRPEVAAPQHLRNELQARPEGDTEMDHAVAVSVKKQRVSFSLFHRATARY